MSISLRALERELAAAGLVWVRARGSHQVYRHETTGAIVVVTRRHGRNRGGLCRRELAQIRRDLERARGQAEQQQQQREEESHHAHHAA